MSSRSTIAGVVLTLNEEYDLDRALSSLTWCDELLVLDSGSTDTTFEIAVKYGARFITHIQEPPFLITTQRNWALDNCGLTSDWVLFLDADEEIGPHLKDHILASILTSDTYNAYELTPRFWFLGRWLKKTQGYPNWHPRLLRRGFNHFDGGVWESFSSSSHVSRITIPYEHYAFSKGLDDWLKRHMRYSTWDAQQIYDYNHSPSQSTYAFTRFRFVRELSSSLWPFRPFARFIQKFIINGGVLEGWQALLYCVLISIYDIFTLVKYIELTRKKQGLPL